MNILTALHNTLTHNYVNVFTFFQFHDAQRLLATVAYMFSVIPLEEFELQLSAVNRKI